MSGDFPKFPEVRAAYSDVGSPQPGQFGTYWTPTAPSSRDLWALQHQAQIVVTNNYVCDGETGV